MPTAEFYRTRTARTQDFDPVEFIASISLESRLRTDPYILVWTEIGLYSPNHKRWVRNCVDPASPDMAAYDYLEDAIAKNDSGTVFWFSPALSPTESHKIIATEIYTAKNGAKITYNYAVLFLKSKLSTEQFLDAANEIAGYAKEDAVDIAVERRKKPIFLTGTTVHWTHFADKVLPNEEWGRIQSKEVWVTKRETLEAIARGEENIYGENPLSCPLDAFDTMFNLGDITFCPNCQKTVRVAEGAICNGCGKTRPKSCRA